MGEGMSDRASQAFVRELRRALWHYYDPNELRKSPLVRLLAAGPRVDIASLRRALASAIEALKPQGRASRQSSAWRIYQTLSSRYLQQFSQAEVARDLGLSVRQMARQDALALQALAEYLWDRHQLLDKVDASWPACGQGPAEPTEADTQGLSPEQELQWAGTSLKAETISAQDLLQGLLETAQPLARTCGACLELNGAEYLPQLTVQRATARQALLNILAAAMRGSGGGDIVIDVEGDAQQLRVCIAPWVAHGASGSPSDDQAENVAMARHLLALSGGSAEVVSGRDGQCSLIRIVLQAVQQTPVLAIDDNVDALRLFERCLADTSYVCIAARDAQQALALAEKRPPQAIVLDVMLPEVDGWEVLARLREHPGMRGVPIVVCTILPQEELALALGATGFLRKPFSRTDLLAALDRAVGLRRPESH